MVEGLNQFQSADPVKLGSFKDRVTWAVYGLDALGIQSGHW